MERANSKRAESTESLGKGTVPHQRRRQTRVGQVSRDWEEGSLGRAARAGSRNWEGT